MKGKNIKNWKILIFIMILALIISTVMCLFNTTKTELKTIKSEKQLEKIYKGESDEGINKTLALILGMPFSPLYNLFNGYGYNEYGSSIDLITDQIGSSSSLPKNAISSSEEKIVSSAKDYSTTNIQVENVDEADITKTDGDYIYSISEDNVVITNVTNPKEIKIASKISISDNVIPEDLLLYGNKLVVIATESSNTSSSLYYYYSDYSSKDNTVVKVYDITDRNNPKVLKTYKLYEPYYTSRCINNKLYVISSGNLRKEDKKIVTYYTEDYDQKEIELKNIKYFNDIKTNKQTLISMLDLDNTEKEVNVNSYLMDISNAYVSENNIYLLDQEYEGRYGEPKISSLFGIWGAFGIFKDEFYDDYEYGYYTKVYKFNILGNGEIKYSGKTKTDGKTINQYSVDEHNGNLRLALYDNKGSRIVIFDKNLNEIGKTSYLAKGENMYSSRFMGDKAYLVTYRTMDPLYVIDLKDETNPKVLGELKIPGYSTYLHPYDENHIIGIGMETKEIINKNSSGRVISTSARIVGMKMALFDVTDVRNPVQVSSTVIGDSRTTSAILTNPKALLFSKEKELIAIPVNNYAEDFEVTNSSTTYSSIISSYTNYSKPYISEGYAVYKINLTDGIKLKGIITHSSDDLYTRYSYYTKTKLLRGLYINENLYTVSENQIKVNKLDNLELVSEIDVKLKKLVNDTKVTDTVINDIINEISSNTVLNNEIDLQNNILNSEVEERNILIGE